MGREFSESDYPLQDLTERIIAAAIEVHRALGPGFLEKIYENALAVELDLRGHRVDRQTSFDVEYKDHLVGRHRVDLLVHDAVVVELKSVEKFAPAHQAQLRSTIKAAGKRVGLLLNFNLPKLTDGLKRVIN